MMLSTADLEAYLDESLPPEEMATIEKASRGDLAMVRSLASIHAPRGAGVATLGEIWRPRRLSCPTPPSSSGSCLLGAMADEFARCVAISASRWSAAAIAKQTSPICNRKRSVRSRLPSPGGEEYFPIKLAGYMKTV